MKFALAAFASLFVTANFAQADVITCNQTEPFITEIYDTDTGTSTITSPGEDTVLTTGLKFIIKGGGVFQIRNSDGSLRSTLILTYQASDGMSDLLYPFSAGPGINGEIACYSTELPAIESMQ